MSTEIVEIFQYVGGKYIVIPGCSDGVYLRRALVIGDQHIERDRREEGRLTIFPAHEEHSLAVSSETCFPLEETEKGLDICLLEKLERERGAYYALGLLAKLLGEQDRALPGCPDVF